MTAPSQIALVTGSSGGIGAATAERLHAAGATVIGCDRTAPESLPKWLADFRELDVTDEQAVHDTVTGIRAQYGAIGVLVHAAGILGNEPDLLTTPSSEFARVMAINATGSFSVLREVGLVMRAQSFGSMVAVASVAAKEARRAYVPYNASKAAVLNICWSLALELGPDNVSVNCVCPGPVNTAMWDQLADRAGGGDPEGDRRAREARSAQIPMGRFAEPEEVAATIAFLTDPANRYLTGLSLDVAGGARLGMGS
ncbi:MULTISPECIES: SDR family oxidoreductase [unclassified Streptomyces]|uniref:SDR family NAD(P)-dependent oxidoreductase n=1 Tax=unclassified Streptomyces TaxID=2593676 RepID=UPI002DDC8866|nr:MULTISPECIES: SDR family oxidoreductase [unclassified Streptomyces]WSA90532.1 SDR family oxidoreductase [Streptomyces sp. NBC_01795]WSB74857.1 SDR family oxidoreductase [Streptomyces sp. NBC_01775]WSS16860.1 SDR family oxidoreductase [Streptomyces sp. NBC_01186]WSS45602.1 SDR family oxidoreductase [Streptomyces sp. NBC_01187]